MKETSFAALMKSRADLIQKIDDIDAELGRRGVRPIAKPIGRARDVAPLVIAAMQHGPRTTREIANVTGQTMHATAQMLSKMTIARELRRVERGTYALPVPQS